MLKERVVFLKEGLLEFQSTGALCSTSRWAVKALTHPIREDRSPQKILELGPGTGSVTLQILEDMLPGDELTICEINPRFMESLKTRLEKEPLFLKHKDKVRFLTCAAQELPEDARYDIIICSLPFLNFPVQVIEEIFSKLSRLSTKQTIMTYYQYMGLRSLKKIVSAPEQKKNVKAMESFFDAALKRYHGARTKVWLNFLPINIYTLQLSPF
jgi:phospholipid N-methyltransferase